MDQNLNNFHQSDDNEQLNYFTAYERSKSRAPNERARSRTLGGSRQESPQFGHQIVTKTQTELVEETETKEISIQADSFLQVKKKKKVLKKTRI